MPRYCYAISDQDQPLLGTGRHDRIDGYLVEWSEELAAQRLVFADGEIAGLLVGWVFDPVAQDFLAGDIELAADITTVDALERYLESLAGAFFVVTSARFGSRLYMDPGATLPIFWRTDRRIAGSSPVEIASAAEREAAFDAELHAACIGNEGMGSWIGGDLSAYRNIRKLLPNHYLALEESAATRHWPRDMAWLEFPAAVEQASSALLAFTTAAAKRFDLKIALTAGYDTRLVLASSRKAVSEVEYFTLAARGSEIDRWAAGELARRLDLKHRVLPLIPSTPEDIAMWDERVGYSVRESNREQFRSVAALGPSAIIATGMYGEVGRCRLYRQNVDTINQMTVSAAFVAARLTIPAPPPVLRSLEQWVERLAGFPPSVIMDLAFLELKFGSWAMGQKPATSQAAFTISPMAQRPVLSAFIFTKPEEKRTTRLFDALIAACWPEAASLPVNKYGDYRDQLALLRKAANPNRVRRFLRDRLARSGAG